MAAAAISCQVFAQGRGAYAYAPSEVPQPFVGPEDDSGGHDAARAAYTAGLDAFQGGEYKKAAELFTRADALSSSPNAKLMLARCLRQIGRPVEAYRLLLECTRQAETTDPMRYARTRLAASLEIEVLRDQLGLLTVYVHAPRGPAYLHVAGQQIPPHQWDTPLPVAPGLVKLSLETLPGLIEHREIEVLAGESASLVIGTPPDVTIPLEVAAPQPTEAGGAARANDSEASPLRVMSYLAAGTGAAGLVTFGILGGLSAAAYERLDEACPTRADCDEALRPTARRGAALQTGANIALVAGIAALGAGITLFAISDSSDVGPARATVAASAQGLRVRGEF